MSEVIRILLADDHPIVRRGMVSILNIEDDIEVIGEAENGEEAVTRTLSLKPDVVLMDLQMPVVDGVEAIRRIRAKMPDAKILILTTFADDDHIMEGIAAGARGYLLKDAPPDRLIEAIRATFRGKSLLNPGVAARILDRFSHMMDEGMKPSSEPKSATAADENLPNLTPRELEVLQLLGQGDRNKDIARKLHIVERTVKIHVGNILSKLNASNRTEAVTTAIKLGLLNNKSK